MKRTFEEIDAIIDRQWDAKEIKTNWLAFETIIRDIVESAATVENITKSDVIILLNEALAAFTGRGRAV